jgi:hypothetical protein
MAALFMLERHTRAGGKHSDTAPDKQGPLSIHNTPSYCC